MRFAMTLPETPASLALQENGLLRALVHATYWLDDALQAYMKAHAGLSLPRAQSMTMIYLTEGVDRPADLAGKLKVSKQATRKALEGLQAKGMVELTVDPNNGRQKIVSFTQFGRGLGLIAKRGLSELEAELARRIGLERIENLREALDADWGLPPDMEDTIPRSKVPAGESEANR